MKTFAVNSELFPIKAHFFFSAAGMSPVVPFLPTIAKQLGFSTVVVGIIYTILPFIALLMKPLSGIVSDRFQLHKTLFLAFQVIGIVSLLGINFIQPLQHMAAVRIAGNGSELRHCPVAGQLDSCAAAADIVRLGHEAAVELVSCTITCPAADPERTVQLRSTINMSALAFVDDCVRMPLVANDGPYANGQCRMLCNDANLMYQITDGRISDATVTQLPQFWQFFVCMVVSWTAMTVVGNLADTICFQVLGDRPQLYGKQRLWAAVGWGVFSLIAGYMVDRMSPGGVPKDYSGVFVMMAVLLACDLICSCSLKEIRTTRSGRMLRELGSLVRSPPICVFLVVCVAVGVGTALIWNFLFWHLEELAEANAGGCRSARQWMKTLQGLAMGVQCFGGELPFFFYSGALLKRIGHTHAMSLVLLTMSVRFLLYAVLSNPWWVLPIELCQGITYGIFYSTMASYASQVAPPGLASTVQGLVGALHEGIGIAAGSLIGGVLMARLGGSLTFRWYGYVGLALCAAHVLVQATMRRCGTAHGLDGAVEAHDDDDERGAKVEAHEMYRSIAAASSGDDDGQRKE